MSSHTSVRRSVGRSCPELRPRRLRRRADEGVGRHGRIVAGDGGGVVLLE
uniref:Uncharacterized protein n=1 Tax=uncultured Nocardioidaceae bacterium TaxID=253824 RepID=A0A6J4M8U4_9ACTN|nr:MAG: hypothetical protein AVDCRST_MAG46-2646 [uncultured Nocardioidaceae bacterium]